MSELLFVKSGESDNPVTKRFEMSINKIKRIVRSRNLRYLGSNLTKIGDDSRMSDYIDPCYVLLNLDETEKEELNLQDVGLYLVEDLRPSEIVTKNAL